MLDTENPADNAAVAGETKPKLAHRLTPKPLQPLPVSLWYDQEESRMMLEKEEAALREAGHKVLGVKKARKMVQYEVEPKGQPEFRLFLVCEQEFPAQAPECVVEKLTLEGSKPVGFDSKTLEQWNQGSSLAEIANEFSLQQEHPYRSALQRFWNRSREFVSSRLGMAVMGVAVAALLLLIVMFTIVMPQILKAQEKTNLTDLRDTVIQQSITVRPDLQPTSTAMPRVQTFTWNTPTPIPITVKTEGDAVVAPQPVPPVGSTPTP
ncbi:MAG TPA: hypothetical protein VH186_05395 [Chloroflexia bacterium]|nr:hypothetical protein [Chloroflexia bacterium]